MSANQGKERDEKLVEFASARIRDKLAAGRAKGRGGWDDTNSDDMVPEIPYRCDDATLIEQKPVAEGKPS